MTCLDDESRESQTALGSVGHGTELLHKTKGITGFSFYTVNRPDSACLCPAPSDLCSLFRFFSLFLSPGLGDEVSSSRLNERYLIPLTQPYQKEQYSGSLRPFSISFETGEKPKKDCQLIRIFQQPPEEQKPRFNCFKNSLRGRVALTSPHL